MIFRVLPRPCPCFPKSGFVKKHKCITFTFGIPQILLAVLIGPIALVKIITGIEQKRKLPKNAFLSSPSSYFAVFILMAHHPKQYPGRMEPD